MSGATDLIKPLNFSCSFMSFFNKISDPAIGGTYMTFLNSASNLGFKWTNSLAIWATGQLTFRG